VISPKLRRLCERFQVKSEYLPVQIAQPNGKLWPEQYAIMHPLEAPSATRSARLAAEPTCQRKVSRFAFWPISRVTSEATRQLLAGVLDEPPKPSFLCRSCHSARSAWTGSTVAALRDGTYVAIHAMAMIESVAVTYVYGSIGLT
jgi:hypothetical protein